MRRLFILTAVAVTLPWTARIAAQGPAPPPDPVTLVSAAEYPSLQEAIDNERYLYIPTGYHALNESLVIDGWDGGVIAGGGPMQTGSVLGFEGEDTGIQIRNCRRLTIYNLQVKAKAIGPEGNAIEITGGEGEINLINLFVFRGSEFLYEQSDGTALSVRAPVSVLLEQVTLDKTKIGLEVDHPDARVTWLGGGPNTTEVNVRQMAGHIALYGLSFGIEPPSDSGVNVELNTAASEPHVIAGCRTERSKYYVRTPATSEPIDVIIKAGADPDWTNFDEHTARFIDYQAAGTLSVLATSSTLGTIEVLSGAGEVYSIGNSLGRTGTPTEPYQLGPQASAVSIGDLRRSFDESVLPFHITAESLEGAGSPVPPNVTFAGSGARIPDFRTPFVEPVGPPLIANIAALIPSVKDYGAVGDGVTDDVDAIQAAIDANEGDSNSEGANPLYFPPGEYLVSRPLDTNRGVGGWWVGAGMDQTTIRSTGGSVVRSNHLSMATFEGMTFEAPIGDPDPVFDMDSDGLSYIDRLSNNFNFHVRCRFVGGAGLVVGRTSGHSQGSECMAIDCEFISCSTGYRVGNANALDNNLVRCLFRDCDVAVSQDPFGSFHVFDTKIENSKVADFDFRGSDISYLQDITSNSPSLVTTENHGGPEMAVFEGLRHLGSSPTEFAYYGGGGTLMFLGSDLGGGRISAWSETGKSIFLVGCTGVAIDALSDVLESGRGYLLSLPSEEEPGIPPAAPDGLDYAVPLGDGGGPATQSSIGTPGGIAVSDDGDLYIADVEGDVLRRLDGQTGELSTIAGIGLAGYAGDGLQAPEAALDLRPGGPGVLTLDVSGNLYIADTGNHRVRKIDAETGVISTVAGTGVDGFSGDDGPATEAALSYPTAVAIGPTGGLYIAARTRVRRVDLVSGEITTAAGNGAYGYSGDGGPATAATLNGISGIALDVSGNLYISDRGNFRIRKVDRATDQIQTVGGIGLSGTGVYDRGGVTGTATSVGEVAGLAVYGGELYLADVGLHAIGKIDTEGVLKLAFGTGEAGFSGDGADALAATLNGPRSLAFDADGDLWIGDAGNRRIRKVDAATGLITTVAGTGTFAGDGGSAASAALSAPRAVFSDPAGNLYIADSQNNRLRRIDAETGIISTVAGSGSGEESGDFGAATDAGFVGLSDVFVAGEGVVYIADDVAGAVRKVDGDGEITTVVGSDGVGEPVGLFVNQAGDVFIADREKNAILKATVDGTVTEVIGNSELSRPADVIVDGWGNLYIADSGNHRIRRLDVGPAEIATVVGTGYRGLGTGGGATQAELNRPEGVFLDGRGDLFIADTGNGRVLKVDAVTEEVTEVVSGLSDPQAVFVDGEGTLFIAETGRNRIPKITGAGAPTVIPVKPVPIAVSLSRESGRTDGGTEVTLTGANFVAGVTVAVGADMASEIAIVSSREIVFTTPAGTLGSVDVVVTNPDDQTATLAGAFTYEEASGPDFDGDGVVGFDDFLAFAGAFGSRLGDADFEAKFDLTDDGRVDFADFLEFAGAFGRRL